MGRKLMYPKGFNTVLIFVALTLMSAVIGFKFSQLPTVLPTSGTTLIGVSNAGQDRRYDIDSLKAYFGGSGTLQSVTTNGDTTTNPMLIKQFGKTLTLLTVGTVKVQDTSGNFSLSMTQSLVSGNPAYLVYYFGGNTQRLTALPTTNIVDTLPLGSGLIALTEQIPKIQGARVSGLMNSNFSEVFTINWPTPFSDTLYTYSVSIGDTSTQTAGLRVVRIGSITPTSIGVIVNNPTIVNINCTVNAIAIHD